MAGKLTISGAARLANTSYNRVVYAIAKGWLSSEMTPLGQLLDKDEVIRWAAKRVANK